MVGNSEGRNVKILESIVNGTPYQNLPQSRVEELLLELKKVIENGGGEKPVYWMGVTTTFLTDGSTVNPIVINGESKLAKDGGMAQYDGEEFVWNGSAWQSIGKNNFGKLAFADSVEASYTPVGDVDQPTISIGIKSTGTVSYVSNVGKLPSLSVTDGVLDFVAGTLPSTSNKNVITNVDNIVSSTPTFRGKKSTITSTVQN